jgi:shikimate kinase
MNQQGQVVYLKVEPETLYKHLKMSKNDRPLLRGKSQEELITFIREQLEKREPFYTKARYILDVTLMDTYDKVNTSVKKLKDLLNL